MGSLLDRLVAAVWDPRKRDPTIARVPEPRMPPEPQATVAAKTFQPGRESTPERPNDPNEQPGASA